MGKRLEQQPMYPQYTYYYPHYLQTKVCDDCALPVFLQHAPGALLPLSRLLSSSVPAPPLPLLICSHLQVTLRFDRLLTVVVLF